MRTIGVITGLAFEARALGAAVRRAGVADRVAIVASGPGGPAAAAAAQELIRQGARALLSMGLAGGLDPALKPGDIVLADAVIGADGRRFACDAALAAACGEVTCRGAIAEAGTPVATREAKHRLYRQTGARAVDMESAGVARAAGAAGLPMLALRTISDTADQAIPEAALAGMREDGGVALAPVLKSLLRRPQELPALLRLGGQTRRARSTLSRLGESLLARLVLMDL